MFGCSDEDGWELKEKIKQLEQELRQKNEQIATLERDLDREKEARASVEARLREAELKCQEQAREAKQQLRDAEAKAEKERKELEMHTDKQRGNMESENKEMRTELEHRIEELQAELRASKMTEEQTTLQLVEMQHEMHKHKDSAAGQAFASKIHQVMANKNKQRADDLGQQLGGLETASEAQQGKYENLSKLHETLLTEKRELATKADQLDAELREEKSKNRDLTAAQLKLQTQFAKCQEEAEVSDPCAALSGVVLRDVYRKQS